MACSIIAPCYGRWPYRQLGRELIATLFITHSGSVRMAVPSFQASERAFYVGITSSQSFPAELPQAE